MSGKSPLGNSKESGSYEGTIAQFPISGFDVIKAKTDPGTNKKFPVTSIWVNTLAGTVWIQVQPGVWIALGSGSGNVLSVIGTANQIASAPTTGNVILSLPLAIIAPGSLTTTTTLTGGTGITATTGNITASAGNVSASGSVTGGTGVTATTGNVTATAGAVNAGTSMTATLGNITATNGNLVLNGAGN